MTSRTQPVQTVPDQRYGEAGKQEAAQRVIPLPDRTQTPTSGAASTPQAPVARPNVFAPTERPNEPLTAGAAAGAGPANFGVLPDTSATELLRAIVVQGLDRDGSIRRLLERMS